MKFCLNLINSLRASFLLCYMCWFIGKAHNEYIFHDIDHKTLVVNPKALATSFEFGLASHKPFESSLDVIFSGPSRWSALVQVQ